MIANNCSPITFHYERAKNEIPLEKTSHDERHTWDKIKIIVEFTTFEIHWIVKVVPKHSTAHQDRLK